MYGVVKKLKNLKMPIKKLMWSKGNLLDRICMLCKELDEVQRRLDENPENKDIPMDQNAWILAFNNACMEEECFLKRKEKVFWLGEGDGNTKFYHKTIKGRQNHKRIHKAK